MKLLLIITFVILLGCAGITIKPPTPTEVQLITQIFVKRSVGADMAPAKREAALAGLYNIKVALMSQAPTDVIAQLECYFGAENADIATLLMVMLQERVNLKVPIAQTDMPYVMAVLNGMEAGLK